MKLANSRLVMQSRQAGFTLIEMMIVVAIIGVLASIAVYAYGKVTTSAEIESEVNAIFAEFRVRQEEYHAETGSYLSTVDEFPPGAPRPPHLAAIDITPFLAAAVSGDGTPAGEWVALRMKPRKQALRCAYTAVAGGAGDAVPGLGGSVLLMGTPESNWYFLEARCDADGDSAVDSRYLTRHDREDTIIQNKGN